MVKNKEVDEKVWLTSPSSLHANIPCTRLAINQMRSPLNKGAACEPHSMSRVFV